MNTNPCDFKPERIEDFVGPARRIAKVLARLVERRKPSGAPIKTMFKGKPGTGKSALTGLLMRQLGCTQWAVHKYNGTQIKMETVEDIARNVQFRSMDGGYTFLWIDEADTIPAKAQQRFLTMMDDLPRHVAVVCTSNREFDEFEERFQTRFQIFQVAGPTVDELTDFLTRFTPDKRLARQIAKCAADPSDDAGECNVRQALLDLDTALLAAD